MVTCGPYLEAFMVTYGPYLKAFLISDAYEILTL